MKKNTTMVTMTMVTAIMVGMLTGCKAYQKVEADQVQPTMEVEEISTKTPEEIAEARRIAREYNEEVQRKAKEKAELEEQRRLAHEANEKLMAESAERKAAEEAQSLAVSKGGNTKSAKTQNTTTSKPQTTTQPTKTETVVQPTNNQPTQNVAQPTNTQPTVVEQPTQPAPQPQPEPQPSQNTPILDENGNIPQDVIWEMLGANPDDFIEVTDTSQWRADGEE